MKTFAIPVACYLGMTLVVPLVDGRHGARYLEHGALVLAVVSVVTALTLLVVRRKAGASFTRT